jgi:hypothetical protein
MMAASELRSKKPRTAPPSTCSPPRTQSWLERLPVELIEQIFLHSLEINMAHTSPFLRKTLSKESMYRTLILFAFFDDDEQNPVEGKHFKPATYRLLSLTDKLRIQKGVLESRWCTMARVKQCLPTLMRLVIVQEWHREREWECVQAEAAAQRDGDDPRQQPPSSLPPLDDTAAVFTLYTSAYACDRPNPLNPDVSFGCQHFQRGMFNVRIFPDRLLNPGSWQNSTNVTNNYNPQPVDFLALLFDGWTNTSAPGAPRITQHTALFHGIETAIRERNRKALNMLLVIHGNYFSSQAPSENGNASVNFPVSLLHLATREGRHSEWILMMLLKDMTREGLVPKDDDVLTKWAIARDQEGSRFAKWLLKVMEDYGPVPPRYSFDVEVAERQAMLGDPT